MNSADLVAKYRFAPDRPLSMPTEGESIQVAWDDFLVMADRIDALEAWKAEAMEVLRRFGAFAHGEYDDVPNVVGVSLTFDNDEELGALQFGDLRAARRLVEKEDGRG